VTPRNAEKTISIRLLENGDERASPAFIRQPSPSMRHRSSSLWRRRAKLPALGATTAPVWRLNNCAQNGHPLVRKGQQPYGDDERQPCRTGIRGFVKASIASGEIRAQARVVRDGLRLMRRREGALLP